MTKSGSVIPGVDPESMNLLMVAQIKPFFVLVRHGEKSGLLFRKLVSEANRWRKSNPTDRPGRRTGQPDVNFTDSNNTFAMIKGGALHRSGLLVQKKGKSDLLTSKNRCLMQTPAVLNPDSIFFYLCANL